jgi:tripartite ATP-independent transporter DctM subunit
MSPITIAFIAIILLLILISLRVPIAFSLGAVGILGIFFTIGPQIGCKTIAVNAFGSIKSWLLVAVPLFIAMGNFAHAAGITSQAYETSNKWLSRLPGGLAIASVFACALFAATSGSSVATAGTMGTVAIPEMSKYGYSKRLASGCVAAGGLLGILIPPSILLVLYGGITGVSVSKLLIAAFIPGILTALCYMVGIVILVKIFPSMAPLTKRFTWKERLRALPKIWGVVVLFLVVMIGIYLGIFTPTEASAIGAAFALCMAIAKTRKKVDKLFTGFESTARTTAMILALVIGASLFTYFLTTAGVPLWVSEKVSALQIGRTWILLIVLAVYIPLGMFLDTISIMLITMPVVFPIINAIGYDGVLFGILVTKMEEISLITPPVGINVYVVKGVAPDIPLSDIFIGIIPFLLIEFIVVAILIIFPGISLWLPSTMGG